MRENQSTKVLGYVTKLDPDKVIGFAMHPNSAQPIEVSLYYNGHQIATQMADCEHDLLKRYELPQAHGFHFNLRQLRAFHWKDVVEIRVGETILPMAPHLAFWQLKNGYLENEQEELFFFMHIPKTAGTSFRMMLYRQFDQESIWPNKVILGAKGGRYPKVNEFREIKDHKEDRVRLIMGHYQLWTIRFMRRRPQVITFLRDPYEQLISLAHHKMRSQSSSLNLLETLENEVMYNPQTYYFLPPYAQTDQLNEADFELARNNMNSCTFVGILPQFEESIRGLEKQLSWKLGKVLVKNKGTKFKLTPELKSVIDIKTFWDRKLYEIALQKFNENK